MKLDIIDLSRTIHQGEFDKVERLLQNIKFVSNQQKQLIFGIVEIDRNNYHGKADKNWSIFKQIEQYLDHASIFTADYIKILKISNLWQTGQLLNAKQTLQQLKEEEHGKWIAAELTRQFSLVLFQEGEIQTAIQLIQKVIDTSSDILQIAQARDNYGYFLRYQGEYDEALQNHLKALPVLLRYRQKIAIANCLENIALINMYQSDLDKAMGRMEQSLKLRKEVGNKYYLGWTLYHLVKLASISSDWFELGEEYLIQLEKLAKDDDNIIDSRYIIARGYLSDFSQQNDRQIKAITSILNRELPEELRIDALLQRIEMKLFDLNNSDNQSQLKEITESINSLRNIGFEHNSTVVTIFIHLFLSKIHHYSLNNKKAKLLLEHAKIMAKYIGNDWLISKIDTQMNNMD